MGKTNRRRNKNTKYILYGLLIVFLLSAGFFFLNMWEKGLIGNFAVPSGNTDYQMFQSEREYGGHEYELKDNIETFLVLGLDKFDGVTDDDAYNNNKQADFLMLFVFDNDAKTCSAIHINRDSMAEIDVLGVAGNSISTVKQQVALAHTYGNGREVSCRNTSDAVSKLLFGMKIDHYISVTMDAVPVYNDLIGGVQVTVLDDFTNIDDSLVKGETVTLMGEQALTYVRTRYGLDDSSNNTRMVRQRQYINALKDITLQRMQGDENFIVESTVKMSDYIVSDRSVTQLQELAEKFSSYNFIEIEDIEGETVAGEEHMEFYPDEKATEEVIIELFYELKD